MITEMVGLNQNSGIIVIVVGIISNVHHRHYSSYHNTRFRSIAGIMIKMAINSCSTMLQDQFHRSRSWSAAQIQYRSQCHIIRHEITN